MPFRPTFNTRRILLILSVALFLQCAALAYSITDRARWPEGISGDVPRGNYVGAASGKWFWINFGPSWPTGDGPNGPHIRIQPLPGLQYLSLPTFVTVVSINVSYTLAPNLLAFAWPITVLLRRRARLKRLQAGVCPNCRYDLAFSTGRCSECGREIDAALQANLERIRRRRELEKTPAPMGC